MRPARQSVLANQPLIFLLNISVRVRMHRLIWDGCMAVAAGGSPQEPVELIAAGVSQGTSLINTFMERQAAAP